MKCDCIASGNVNKPKQYGADPHAKNCIFYAERAKEPLMVADDKVDRAAEFLEHLSQKMQRREPLTEEDAREFSDLGMGEINVKNQTFKMDKEFAKAWLQIVEKHELAKSLEGKAIH